jgi:hypothetical protein
VAWDRFHCPKNLWLANPAILDLAENHATAGEFKFIRYSRQLISIVSHFLRLLNADFNIPMSKPHRVPDKVVPERLLNANSSYHTRREAATGTPDATLHIERMSGTMHLGSVMRRMSIAAMKCYTCHRRFPMKFVPALALAFLISAAPALAQIAPSTKKATPPTQNTPAEPAKSAPVAPPPAATPPPADKIDPAKEAAIRHLMEITETSKLGNSVSTYFESRVRSVISEALGPDRTTKFMETFSKKLEADVPPAAVVDAMVPIYARAFSLEEIQGLNQFYESPLGQRIVKVMPKVEEDSQNAGLQLGNKATLAVLQTMTDEYPELKQMIQDPNAAPNGGAASGQVPPSGATPGATPSK